MRARVLISFAVALIAAAALVSASGAATSKAQKVTRIDVSTRLAVVHYLRSIHVNPKGAVIQRGVRNYAGAHCPGKGWTCASTKHTVVQIARQGGKNRFRCSSSRCVVVQISGVAHGVYVSGRQLASTGAKGGGGGSTASCVKTGSSTTNASGQTCVISQAGSGPNTAYVYENSVKSAGSTLSTVALTAAYTAQITQQVTSGNQGNTACVTQNINLDGSTTVAKGAVSVTLEAHQSVLINQDVAGSGTNNAVNGSNSAGTSCTGTLGQTQTLNSTASGKAGITQNEDDQYLLCGDGVTGEYANLCLNIQQNKGSVGFGVATGLNNATFTQTSTQTAVANTPAGPVTQQQSNPLCGSPLPTPTNCVFAGGLVGTVDQDSKGVSTASATQTETQCEDADIGGLTSCLHNQDTSGIPAALLHQSQYGPVGVFTFRHHHRGRVLFQHGKGLGKSTQTGNPNCIGGCDGFGVNQHSFQYADHGALQLNAGQADCNSTGGSCQAGQTTTINGQDTSDGYTAPVIGNLAITCANGHASCQPTPPPTPMITQKPPTTQFSSAGVFKWTDDATAGITFLCNADQNGFTATNCTSGNSFTSTYGSHSFQVEAMDVGGNTAATTEYDWMNVPPTPSITSSAPDPGSSSTTFTFTDTDTNLTFECQIDNSGYSTCSSPWMYSNLADGSHTFSVKATDGAGHFSAVASSTWTISGGGATANLVDQLNPLSDPGGFCNVGGSMDSVASVTSGSGFDATPQKVTDMADLSAYDGMPIELRFSFNTVDNRYNDFEGWFINNIKVTGAGPVTVFSDPVADGDANFTAISDFGTAPGWHVTDSLTGTMGGPAWWYGNENTGTYQSPNPVDNCTDSSANSGTITTPVFTLQTGSELSFDTLWQIEGVNPSGFDLMDVQVIPVTSAAG